MRQASSTEFVKDFEPMCIHVNGVRVDLFPYGARWEAVVGTHRLVTVSGGDLVECLARVVVLLDGPECAAA